jgi:hypothetical protein
VVKFRYLAIPLACKVTAFVGKLRADSVQGMLAIIQLRIF